jgi:hypothetical protein
MTQQSNYHRAIEETKKLKCDVCGKGFALDPILWCLNKGYPLPKTHKSCRSQ